MNDYHIHTDKETCEQREWDQPSPEDVLAHCKENNIKLAGVVYSDLDVASATMELLDEEGIAFHGWYYVHNAMININKLCKAAERHLVGGIYIDPITTLFHSQEYSPILDIAKANNLPIMVATDCLSTQKTINTQPSLIGSVALMYPSVNIVIAHGGAFGHRIDGYWDGEHLDIDRSLDLISPYKILQKNLESAIEMRNIYIELSALDDPFKVDMLYATLYLSVCKGNSHLIYNRLLMGSSFPYETNIQSYPAILSAKHIDQEIVDMICNNRVCVKI